MKKLVFSFCVFFFTASTAFCQDYVVDYPLNNGYTLVYKKLPPPAQYQNASEKTYGVINNENKIVVPLAYKSILNSGEKSIFIIKDGKDEAGLFSVSAKKVIVEPQFFEIESFSEGLAVVKKRKADYGFAWGAIDVSGKIIIPVEYDYLGSLSEGLMNFQQDKKMGFLDKTNKIIIPAMYYNFSAFSDGLAAVQISENGKYGYIDKDNKLVIAAQYEDADPFYGGFAAVAKKKGYSMSKISQKAVNVPGEWVVINKLGKQIQERSFDKVSRSEEHTSELQSR